MTVPILRTGKALKEVRGMCSAPDHSTAAGCALFPLILRPLHSAPLESESAFADSLLPSEPASQAESSPVSVVEEMLNL